ncbi:glutathione S-transferase family protein [SAR86 cluster bacterium]|nr:glutathione S-transferase family protein [SAR86 cluster bacterium]
MMTQPKLVLYHANWSLCSQMVRVALYEKGLEFDHIPMKLCDQYEEAENLDKDYLKNINPTGVVPVLKINDEIVRDSAYIIERLDDIEGKNQINLWPKEAQAKEELRRWVYDTTITEGVPLGKTLGTAIAIFSLGLVEILVKELSLKAIWKIIRRHPRRERKMVFISTYFFSIKNKVGPLGYKALVDSLVELENNLDDEGYLFGDFNHADINLMCCFYRMVDLRLDSILEMSELPKINSYWERLKNRPSFKKGILDFNDHEESLKKAFPDDFNPHLEILKSKIKEKA